MVMIEKKNLKRRRVQLLVLLRKQLDRYLERRHLIMQEVLQEPMLTVEDHQVLSLLTNVVLQPPTR